jgi:hypothetical protein
VRATTRDNLGEFGSGAVPKTFQRGKVIDVQLNDLQLIRKRINKRFSTDASQNSALTLAKSRLDPRHTVH